MLKALSRARVQALCASALCVILATATMGVSPRTAQAEDEIQNEEISNLQAQIESASEDYNKATARIDEINERVEQNKARLKEITDALPEAKAQASHSVKTLYLIQRDSASLLDMVLSATSITDAIKKVDYLNDIQGKQVENVQALDALREETEQIAQSLDDDMKQAKDEEDRAKRALEQAEAAKQQAIEKAQAEARAQAEAEAAAKAKAEAEAAAKAQAASKSAAAGTDSQNSSMVVDDSASNTAPSGAIDTGSIDWSQDKAAFVNAWAGRIDAFLAGSPMAGMGATFAAAAWDNGVDPRWSPAIAAVESSKGAVCFKPHNAWGWGSSSWGSWEEAINAHVRGLARGYGATLTYGAALKYCPPNADFWYNKTLAYMNSI